MSADQQATKTMRLLASCCIFLFSASALALETRGATLNARRAFDEYGRIRWEDEKARLDNFAIQLSHEPEYVGYIYVFNAPDLCRGEAQARAVRAKRYIVEHRGGPWNRIIWREGGYRDELVTILWIFKADYASSFREFNFEPARKETYVTKNCEARIAKIKRSKWN